MHIMKIHHINDQHDLTAEDFSVPFVLRALVGPEKIALYAALRAIGHDAPASFSNAFGSTLYGGVDAITNAAAAFETTPAFEIALEDAYELLGEKFVKSELQMRGAELRGFACDSAAAISVLLHKKESADAAISVQSALHLRARDEAEYRTFAETRRVELQKVADREASVRSRGFGVEVA